MGVTFKWILAGWFLSVGAFAQSSIQLSCGSSATVSAGDTTTVVCGQGNAANPSSSRYCECYWYNSTGGYRLALYLITPQGESKFISALGKYSAMSECEEKLVTHPSCR